VILQVTGTPQEIRDQITRALDAELAHIQGSANALVIVEGSSPTKPLSDADFARIMAEGAADAVSVGHMDDSREAMYTRMPGE
jgi:hypothetical protein